MLALRLGELILLLDHKLGWRSCGELGSLDARVDAVRGEAVAALRRCLHDASEVARLAAGGRTPCLSRRGRVCG